MGRGVAARDMRDCGYGCGMSVVFAPVAATGRAKAFNPEYVPLDPAVWVLRRGTGMVPCSSLTEQSVAFLRQEGVRGWREHRCPEWDPGVRRFALPGRLTGAAAEVMEV